MRADRPLWIVIAALGIAVLALALRNEQDTIADLHPASIAALITGAVLVVMIFGAVYALFYKRIGELLRAAFFWCAVAGILFAGYNFRLQLQAFGEQALAGVIPGVPMIAQASSGRSVEIVRPREGDFTIRADVNGTRTTMLVDTGASSVVLTAEAAKAAGLPIELLKYDVPIETANGRGKAASVVLDRVAISGIIERKVPALVSTPGDLKTSLLGMSFLKRLESFEVRGEKLVLHAKAAGARKTD
ncbi:MAG TPA: TIGR02281 family clan AA aspartic protease [Xanthobacteraceae bacterium]|nr:TIGR02281 family clan AA aspartic protease [Xanthobacteraceae bacterium]